MSDDAVHRLRQSWNIATRNHNAHKGDQAAFFRAGGDVLFPEELELLGDIDGAELVHLQCNAGQDSLGLARRGARVTGVDLSDEAIGFARRLSRDSGIPARFVEAEILGWMATTEERFDVAFASYGAIGWVQDCAGWFAGAARVLKPGGRLVVIEFHPLVWSYGDDLQLSGDDYFQRTAFEEPVHDYVAQTQGVEPLPNEVVARSWQHTTADLVQGVIDAGLQLRTLREYPHSNFCRLHEELVEGPGRTWHVPEGKPGVPLMLGLVAHKPRSMSG